MKEKVPSLTDIQEEQPLETLLLDTVELWPHPGVRGKAPFSFPIKKDDVLPDGIERLVIGTRTQSSRHGFLPAEDKDVVLKGSGGSDKHAVHRNDRLELSDTRRSRAWKWKKPESRGASDFESDLWGLCTNLEATEDKDVCLQVLAHGGHTLIPKRILAYETIPYRGRGNELHFDTLKELQKKRRLPRSSDAHHDSSQRVESLVCYVRESLCNRRLDDYTLNIKHKEFVLGLIQILHTKFPEVRDLTSYCTWLTRRIATTLAVCHALQLRNNELGSRNITLAGEFADMSACRVDNNKDWQFTELQRVQAFIWNALEHWDLYSDLCKEGITLGMLLDKFNLQYAAQKAHVELSLRKQKAG
jgi:hypothetical protein